MGGLSSEEVVFAGELSGQGEMVEVFGGKLVFGRKKEVIFWDKRLLGMKGGSRLSKTCGWS